MEGPIEVKTHRPPANACPIEGCGRTLDAATGGPSPPAPGDVTICAYCGNWLIFTDELHLREITEAEIDDLDQETFRLLTQMSQEVADIIGRRKR